MIKVISKLRNNNSKKSRLLPYSSTQPSNKKTFYEKIQKGKLKLCLILINIGLTVYV